MRIYLITDLKILCRGVYGLLVIYLFWNLFHQWSKFRRMDPISEKAENPIQELDPRLKS